MHTGYRLINNDVKESIIRSKYVVNQLNYELKVFSWSEPRTNCDPMDMDLVSDEKART